MSVNPFYNPKFRAFDANGTPLSGGRLYTYAAGTTTPLATYTTRAGDVANTNPVLLDANGEADVWTTPGVDYKFVLKNASNVTQWTVDNVPSPAEEDITADVGLDPGGRLTLTSGTPVTTSDVTGATTVYYSPLRSNKVPLYNGTSWAVYSIADELSQTTADNTKSPAAVANDSCYDLFIWNDSGTLRLSRGPAWSSSTSRGTGVGTTELERIDGRYVNKVSISNGPAAQHGLYVGTIRSDGSAQVNDSMAKRHVWNTYNRIARSLRVTEATDAWSYSADAVRQANGSTANQLDIVRGLNEDEVNARVDAVGYTTAAAHNCYAGVGLDSTTAFASGFVSSGYGTAAINVPTAIGGSWRGFPGIGRHILTWLERGSPGTAAAGDLFWLGDNGQPTFIQSGIHGWVLA